VIVPDVNLLLYAHDDRSPWHKPASRWCSDCLSGSETVGISILTVLAFVRLGTKPSLFTNPFSVERAGVAVRDWFRSPVAELLEFQMSELDLTVELLNETGTGGDLTTDAAIAALAISTAESCTARTGISTVFPEFTGSIP